MPQNEGAGPLPAGAPIDLRRIVNTSEMVDRPGFLMRWLARRFDRVSFDLSLVGRIHEAGRDGRVVYVCSRQSTLDYLYFNFAFLKLSLPLAYFANGVRTLIYRPLLQALGYSLRRLFRRVSVQLDEQGRLAAGVRAGRANLLFLRHRRALIQWGAPAVLPLLRRLIELQSDIDEPIRLVPLAVHWDKVPERHKRTLNDLVFGSPTAPGRLRKFVGFLRFHRRATVQVAEPIDLGGFLAEYSTTAAPEALAEQLRWSLHQGLNQEARPLRGPVLKRARHIRDEILRSDGFRRTLERFAEDNGRTTRSVQREAGSYLKEIAADFRIRYVEGFCVALTFVWNRLFSGIDIDMEGLRRIREAAKGAPIVLVPGHRSHIDYLAISWAFYIHGLIPPHIAAGINLSFWPLGHLFRHSGAFFLRRSFRDNPLYALTMRAYIRKLVKEGYWIEFFIEGGRSRTGKSLPPKLGLLGDITHAYLDGAARDICFVPVSLGYERIIEEGAYSRELTGGAKEAENLAGLLRTRKVLRARYGRMHIRFHAPMSLREYAQRQGFEQNGATEQDARRLVTRLGHRLIEGINETAVVTTSSLVATALLCHPKRGMSRATLRMRVGLLLEIANRQNAPLASVLRLGLQARRLEVARAEQEAAALAEAAEPGAEPVPRYQRQRHIDLARGGAVHEAIDEAVNHLLAQKLIRAHPQAKTTAGASAELAASGEERAEPDVVYTPNEDRRISLDIYKNGFIHLLVPHAFAATAILATEKEGLVDVRQTRRVVRFLSRLFKLEFIYGDRHNFVAAYEETRDFFFDMGLIEPDAERPDTAKIHPKAYHLLRFFRGVTVNFLQSYALTAENLPTLVKSPTAEKEVWKSLQSIGNRAFREGELGSPEAVSSVTFRNAIRFFVERGFIERDAKKLVVSRPARLFERWAEHIRSLQG